MRFEGRPLAPVLAYLPISGVGARCCGCLPRDRPCLSEPAPCLLTWRCHRFLRLLEQKAAEARQATKAAKLAKEAAGMRKLSSFFTKRPKT